MKIFRLISCFPLLWLASCSTPTPPATAAAKPVGARVRTVDEWSAEISKNNGYKQNSEGALIPNSTKRSQFEGKNEFHGAQKNYQKQAYKTNDYAKKSWWGNKEYDRKSYAGKTDGSRFQTTSALQGKGARESKSTADIPDTYKTDRYATTSAREANSAAVKKTSNDHIENRRKSFQQPEIFDWREQRAMSVDQSRGILGN